MGLYFDDNLSLDEKIVLARKRSGDRIRKLRKKNNQSLVTAGELCGVSQTYLSKIERGYGDINVAQIAVLADKYDTVAETFFSDSGALAATSIRKVLVAAGICDEKEQVQKLKFMSNAIDDSIRRGNARALALMIRAVLDLCSREDNPWENIFREIDMVKRDI